MNGLLHGTTWRPLTPAVSDGGPWGRWSVHGLGEDGAGLAAALRDAGADAAHGDGPWPEGLDGLVVLADDPGTVLRALAQHPARRLWVVTRDAGREPAPAAARALVGVAGLERPQARAGTVDVEATTDLAVLVPWLRQEDELVLAVRDGAVSGRRLTPLTAGAVSATFRGTQLVTGASGGVGGALARHLAAGGADRLVLLQRSAPDPGLVAGLEALGAAVHVHPGDVRCREDVAAAVAVAGPELRGVLHAAGVAHDGPLDLLTEDAVADAVATKAGGLQHLLDATADHDLDLVVACSSLTGILGLPRQGAYAAANAALDAVAAKAHATGRPAVGVAWAAWDEVGGAHTRGAGRTLRRLGLPPLSPDEALAGLDAALATGLAHAAVVRADWRRLVDVLWLGTPPALLRDLLAPTEPGTRALD